MKMMHDYTFKNEIITTSFVFFKLIISISNLNNYCFYHFITK